VFHPPSGSKTDFVKRIIGVPGDLIDIDNEFVYVNGEKTEWVDTMTSRRRSDGYYPVKVPPGAYYVLGDNRRVSIDSRNWEFVASKELVGRAWAILWPTSDFQIFG
jgi:signal peptidase I